MAVAAPTGTALTTRSSLDSFVKSVKYETSDSVLRKCDKPPTVQENRTQSTTSPPVQADTDSVTQEIYHTRPDHTGVSSSINLRPLKFANPNL